MPTSTYEPIVTYTAPSAQSSVTFNPISSAYTDLVLVVNSSNSVSTNQPYIQINSDTSGSSTNYSTTSMRGDGSSAASGRHSNNFGWFPVPGPGVGNNGNFNPWIVHIMNYANTTTYKSALSRFNNASSILSANAHLWRSTAAISSITVVMESGNFLTGSTFTLYGIKAA